MIKDQLQKVNYIIFLLCMVEMLYKELRKSSNMSTMDRKTLHFCRV